jgi:hypothetical protein
MAFYYSETDLQLGKVLKYRRPNPVGEDMYLRPDGTIESDEFRIIKVQRIFKENYYKAGGPWDIKTREKYASCVAHTDTDEPIIN